MRKIITLIVLCLFETCDGINFHRTFFTIENRYCEGYNNM